MTHQHSALRQRMIDDMVFRNMSPSGIDKLTRWIRLSNGVSVIA